MTKELPNIPDQDDKEMALAYEKVRLVASTLGRTPKHGILKALALNPASSLRLQKNPMFRMPFFKKEERREIDL